MNANEVYPWMLMRKCLLAMLILMLVILMLILMLLNLNTGYADTDADLCIKIMSLWYTSRIVQNALSLKKVLLYFCALNIQTKFTVMISKEGLPIECLSLECVRSRVWPFWSCNEHAFLAHIGWELKWAYLIANHLSVRTLFTCLSSSPEPVGQ